MHACVHTAPGCPRCSLTCICIGVPTRMPALLRLSRQWWRLLAGLAVRLSELLVWHRQADR